MKRVFIAFVVALAACGPSARGPLAALPPRPRAEPSPPEAPPRALSRDTDAETASAADPLALREASLARVLRDAGTSEPSLVGRGFLASRESAVHEVVVPDGACLTFTALATDGIRDLDAELFHPSGEALAVDAADDAHPTIQVCPREGLPQRLALRVVDVEGHGAYRIAAFPSPEAALPAIARAIGGTPGRVRSRDADPVAARVAERADTALRRGFEVLEEPREISLAPEQTVWVPVPLRPGRCLLAFVVPESGLERITARLLDGDGTELARSDDTTPEVTLQFCAERRRELVLLISARRGGGRVRVFTLTAPNSRLGGADSLTFGQTASRRTDAGSANSAAGTRDCIPFARAALDRAEAAGFRAAGPPRCLSLARGEAERALVPVEAGGCVRVEIVAGRDVARPAVTLSLDGLPLAESVGPGLGAPALAHACSPTAQTLEATLVARSGSGSIGFVVTTRRAESTDLAAEMHRLDAQARATAAELVPTPAEEAACTASSPRGVELVPGTCARMIFVAEDAAPVSVCAERDGESVACDAGPAPELAYCAPPRDTRRLVLRCTPQRGDLVRGRWLIATRRPAL